MSDYGYVQSDIHIEITDRICELENFIEGFLPEEIEAYAEAEVSEAREAIEELEEARFILDKYGF